MRSNHRYSRPRPSSRAQSPRSENYQQDDLPSRSTAFGFSTFAAPVPLPMNLEPPGSTASGKPSRTIAETQNRFGDSWKETIPVDCSVAIIPPATASTHSSPGVGLCSCESVALDLVPRDPDQRGTLSEALRQCRRRHCLERTGQWLFELNTFTQWLESSRSSILWLVGSPGTGKSMLSSAVLEKLDAESHSGDIVTFWFSDGRFKESQWIPGVLLNLVSTLLSQSTNRRSRDRLLALAADLALIQDQLSLSELRCFLVVLRHSLGHYKTLFLVLDGFDDSSFGQTRYDLLHTFLDVFGSSDTSHRIKIFISSRPKYASYLGLGNCLRIDMDSEREARLDLDIYIRIGAHKLQSSKPSEDFEKLAGLLCSNPHTTFLTAGLALRYLSCSNSPLTWSTSILEITHRSDLSSLYDGMLDAVIDKKLAKNLLTWAAYTGRPLFLQEMEYLSQLTDISNEDISVMSGGLLSISRSQTVSFVHLTARDHLLSLREGSRHWLGSSSSAHEMIAQACLKVLSSVDLLQCFGVFSKEGYDLCNAKQLLRSSYARQYLSFHCTNGEPRSHSLPGLLHSYLIKGLDSKDFKQYARSVPSDQETSFGTVRTCGSTPAQCMKSRLVLGIAADFGLEKLARLELQMGGNAHLDCRSESRFEFPPLHLATMAGHINVVKLLLQYGADIATRSPAGRTPLFYAISNGFCDILRLFLSHAGVAKKESDNHRTIRPKYEQLHLVARISKICDGCTDQQPRFIISKPPKDCQQGIWPSIHVMGDPLSGRDLCLSSLLCPASNQKFLSRREGLEGKAIIKWFAGADMYHALEIAAKRGIGIVRELLIAAENDRGLIDSLTSVTELVAKLRIS